MVPKKPSKEILAPDTEGVERVARSQALEPGVYWRAIKDVEIRDPDSDFRGWDVESGTVLLLADIEWCDGSPHTAVLRAHPRWGDSTMKLLINDFVTSFVPAPDGPAVRAQEMAEIQGEIAALQQEINDGQRDPSIVVPAIEDGIKRWEKEQARKSRGEKRPARRALTASLAGPGSFSLPNVIGRQVSAGDVSALAHVAERQGKLAELKMEWIQKRTGQISEKVKALVPFYSECAGVALARTSAVRKQYEAIRKGLESLDLYTGKGVEVHAIKKGKGATGEEPLTLMQRKLFMGEELAAFADVDAKFDYRRIEAFDKALEEFPALVSQIFPTPRCVVSMAVRRDPVDYGDRVMNFTLNRINESAFLLVRDGENIYRVHSTVQSHELAERLFPTKNEFDELFRGIDGMSINFQDVRFTDRAARSDNLALHYKRFLILLCGLDHRLRLFGAFYPEAEALSFISIGFQESHMRFLADDDRGSLLGDGAAGIDEWIADKNSYLRSGSRVACFYGDLLTERTAPSCRKAVYVRGHYEVERPANPKSSGGIHVVYRDGRDLCVGVPVVHAAAEYREMRRPEFTARVNLRAYKEAKEEAYGYLCLDAVTADELDRYIYDRESRVGHVGYIRLFKLASAALRKEEHAEEASRAYLKESAVQAGIAVAEAADLAVAEAVRAWRCANGGKALPGLDDKAGLDVLLNQIYARARQADRFIHDAERLASEKDVVPLKLVLTGRNRLALYAEVPVSERDESLGMWGWVKRVALEVRATKLSDISERLVWLDETTNAGEMEIHRWDGYEKWVNATGPVTTPVALTAARAVVLEESTKAFNVFRGKGLGIADDAFNAVWREWEKRIREPGHGRSVPTVYLSIPVAVFETKTGLQYLLVQELTEQWLFHFGNAKQRAAVEKFYVGQYAKQDAARERLHGGFEPSLTVCEDGKDRAGLWFGARDLFYTPRHLSAACDTDESDSSRSVTLRAKIRRWLKLCKSKSREFDAPGRIVVNDDVFKVDRFQDVLDMGPV